MRGHIAYVSNDPVQAYKDGYAKGLQEAREGIAAILADEVLPPLIGTAEFRRSFLAAIDALRQPPPLTAHYDPAAKDNRP